MHAVVVERFGDPSVLIWRERETPAPAGDRVTIRVAATGVNFADIAARRGTGKGAPLPLVPGLDAAGTVVAAGPQADATLVGRRVAAYADGGSYREVMTARSALVYPLPDDVGDETGAALNLLVTAFNVLAAAQLEADDTVLIHAAAGGVGSTAVQMAAARGVRVIAVVGSAAKAARARELGAAVTIDSSLDVLVPFGRYVVYGQASGAPGRLTTDRLHRDNRRVIGYSSGGYRTHRPQALRPAVDAALALVRSGAVHVEIGARFALRDAAAAHRLVESRASTGKVLLVP